MGGLLDSLSMAARALDAQRFGLDVAGQNIANVNTPGYTHRMALFAAVPGVDRWSAGNGVEIQGLRGTRDMRLEQRLQQERPAAEREAAIADVMAVVETAIGKPGESIDAAMNELFDSFGRLAADPTSSVERQQTILQGSNLASAFHDMVDRLSLARRDADSGVRGGVDEINGLLNRIARANVQLGQIDPSSSEAQVVRDDLGEALKALSKLVDIDTIARPNGGADVTFGNGRPLVIGENTYPLQTAVIGPDGVTHVLTSEGINVTAEITGGRIGGLIHSRDVLIPGYVARLDELAYAVATQVNAVHRTGYDLDGTTNRNFFVEPAAVAGAASAMAVDPAILASPSAVAAAGVAGAPGNNTVARNLAALRDVRSMSGGTATLGDTWSQLVYRVGADSKSAQDEHASRSEIVRQVELLREQVSGISLDEEAMMMMKFQRAYEANARFFQAIDTTLDTLMQTVAR
jgi:flagellar hook-associated protein 1 FlgK